MTKEGVSRRKFLRILGAGSCGAAVHSAISSPTSMMAYALPPIHAALGPKPIMVFLNLSGGCSLNIAPMYHGAWRDKFPDTSFSPEDSRPVGPDQGLHLAFANIQQLWNEGSVALLNKVGYRNQSRSHADSADAIWQGNDDGRVTSSAAVEGGWGARLTCQMATIFGGISFGGSNTLIEGSCNPPRSFGDLNGFGEDRFVWSGSRTEWLQDRRETLLAMAGEANNKGKRYVRESMLNISASVEAIQNATAGNLPYSFPNTSLGRACRDVAKVIRAGNTLGTQFFFLDRGGFDTHSDQNGTLNNNLSDIDASIGALANAAKGLGVWNRMIIVTMTEFGRTFGNNRAGEDHGDYWSSLVLGGQVNGGRIVNPGPSASEVAAADGFLRGHEIHYGQVFWETIAAMGYDPNQVFPNRNFSSYSLNLFR